MDHVTQDHGDTIDMEHVADSALDDIQRGKIIKGEIVTFDNDFVYVNVGTKSDGRISIEEFEDTPQVGAVIDVMLKTKRFVDGMYQFSMAEAESIKKWQEFIEWYKAGNVIIEGKILSANNKGKSVECRGIHAFLPFSLSADLRTVSTSDESYSFKIKGVDEKKRSMLVSRKDYLDDVMTQRWDNFVAMYKPGDHIEGEVIKFVEFGAFVRVAGIDALLHRNDMSWKKVFKQRKLLKVGETREFLILDINREAGKISLSLKQLADDPWSSIADRYRVGDVIKGRIVTITTYGAFAEIEDGVEGFVANTDLSWTRMNANVKDYFNKGDEIDFKILDINGEERKLSLGYKQVLANPWDTIHERFPIGSVFTKKIKKIVKFGMFVELEEGIDGLVHISDVSWDENVKDLGGTYTAGDEVTFKILEIKKSDMKISCGMKQLTRSPWEAIREKYPPRMRVDGVISGITQFGIFVKLEDDVEGLVHISEVSRRRLENLEEHFKVGDKVGAVVLGVDVEKKRLSLSIKNYEMITEKEELDKIMRNTSSRTVTIGDMVNIKFGE